MAIAGDIRAGGAYVEIGARTQALDRALNGAMARMEKFGQQMRMIGTRLMAASAAMLAPLALSVREFAKYGDTIAKMSRRTGLTTEAVSELGYAAQIAGADIGSLEKGIRRMQKNMWDAEKGLTTAIDALAKLGLAYETLQGLAPEEQFERIGGALAEVTDASTKAALAQDLFGRAGTALIPLLNLGAEGIARLRTEARNLGVSLTYESAAGAEELTDSFTALKASVRSVGLLIGGTLAPAVKTLTDRISGALKGTVSWSKENKKLSDTLVMVAVGIGMAVGALGGLALAIAGITAAIKTLKAHPLAAAIGVGLVAVAGLVTTLKLWRTTAESATEAQGELKKAMGQVAAAAEEQNEAIDNVIGKYDQLASARDMAEGKEPTLARLYHPEFGNPKQQLEYYKVILADLRSKIKDTMRVMAQTPGGPWTGDERYQQRMEMLQNRLEGWSKQMDIIQGKYDNLADTLKKITPELYAAWFPEPPKEWLGQVAGFRQSGTTGYQVAGTFSGYAAQMVGGGGVQQRQLTVQERMLDNLNRIEENTRRDRYGTTAILAP